MALIELDHFGNLATVAGILLVTVVLLHARFVLSRPISKLPGPFLTKWSDVPLKRASLTGNRLTWVHDLHQKYGPIVRLSTSEVSVTDLAAIKKVYKVGSQYLKSDFYKAFGGPVKERNLFTQQDFKLHGEHRRLVSSNFSDKWVKAMEPYIARNVQLAVTRMAEEHKQQGYVDTLKWFMFMATDVIGEAAFGESFHTLETGEVSQYIKDVGAAGTRGVIRAEFPLLSFLLEKIPNQYTKDVIKAIYRLQECAQQSVDRYWKLYKADPDNVKPTLLTKEYACVENGEMTVPQLRRDASGYIIAGTDTTANTANFAVWQLSKHPEIEKQIIAEVAGLPSDFDDEQLRTLPTLANVIHETLRVSSVVGQGLPRSVPADGVEFCGHYLPAGTTVGIPAYTVHRNEEIFPEPEAFKPERWTHPTKEMKESFLAWGGGSRVCLGMHFAQLELRHALANFYRTFDSGMKMSKAEGFSEKDMEYVSHFIVGPRGKRTLMQRR